MNKHDWQTLLDAWERKRASQRCKMGYDKSVFICSIAVDFSTAEYKRFRKGIHAALTEDA